MTVMRSSGGMGTGVESVAGTGGAYANGAIGSADDGGRSGAVMRPPARAERGERRGDHTADRPRTRADADVSRSRRYLPAFTSQDTDVTISRRDFLGAGAAAAAG